MSRVTTGSAGLLLGQALFAKEGLGRPLDVFLLGQ